MNNELIRCTCNRPGGHHQRNCLVERHRLELDQARDSLVRFDDAFAEGKMSAEALARAHRLGTRDTLVQRVKMLEARRPRRARAA